MRPSSTMCYWLLAAMFLLQTQASLFLTMRASQKKPVRYRPIRSRSERDLVVVEQNLQERGHRFVVGSDESGRGCIAGPIVAASCCILPDISSSHQDVFKPIEGVNDSKLLTNEDRHRIFNEIINQPQNYVWAVCQRSNQDIDSIGLEKATMDCFQESIEQVVSRIPEEGTKYSIVDGHKSPKLQDLSSRPWKSGDSIVYTVALASILARITHENVMKAAHEDLPAYGFAENNGYPTHSHILALHQTGPSLFHRQSCKPVKERGAAAA